MTECGLTETPGPPPSDRDGREYDWEFLMCLMPLDDCALDYMAEHMEWYTETRQAMIADQIEKRAARRKNSEK